MAGSTSARDWDDLARVDPFWAIASEKGRSQGRWNLDDFFATGAREVGHVLEVGRRFGLPATTSRALDFGCGVGRLTRALSATFDRCVGLDASGEMIAQANALNADRPAIVFAVNENNDLRAYDADRFDLVLSLLVLQHLPSRSTIEMLISEFCRVLRPGGLLAFQASTWIPARHRIQPRPRLYRTFRHWGLRTATLHRAGLTPITMRAIAERRVGELLDAGRVRLLAADRSVSRERVVSATYFVTK